MGINIAPRHAVCLYLSTIERVLVSTCTLFVPCIYILIVGPMQRTCNDVYI